MNFDERQMRMSQLKKREKRMDVDAWVRGFMAGMSTLATDLYSGKIFTSFYRIITSRILYRKYVHMKFDT